jgi:hypothetical protein
MNENGSFRSKGNITTLEKFNLKYAKRKTKLLVNEEFRIDNNVYDIKIYESFTDSAHQYIFTCFEISDSMGMYRSPTKRSPFIKNFEEESSQIFENEDPTEANALKYVCEFRDRVGISPQKIMIHEVKFESPTQSFLSSKPSKKGKRKEQKILEKYETNNLILCIYENSFPHFLKFTLFQPFSHNEWCYQIDDSKIYKLISWENRLKFIENTTQSLLTRRTSFNTLKKEKDKEKQDFLSKEENNNDKLTIFQYPAEIIIKSFKEMWKTQHNLNSSPTEIGLNEVYSKVVDINEEIYLEFNVFASSHHFWHISIQSIGAFSGKVISHFQVD